MLACLFALKKKVGVFLAEAASLSTTVPSTAFPAGRSRQRGVSSDRVTQAGSEPARAFLFTFPLPETKAAEEKRCVSRKAAPGINDCQSHTAGLTCFLTSPGIKVSTSLLIRTCRRCGCRCRVEAAVFPQR